MTHVFVELHEAEVITLTPLSFVVSGFGESFDEMRVILVIYFNMCELQNSYEMISWVDCILSNFSSMTWAGEQNVEKIPD